MVLALSVSLNYLWDLGGFTTICLTELPVGSGWFYHCLSLWFICGIWVVLPLSVSLNNLSVLPPPFSLNNLWDLGGFTTICLSELPVGSGWFYHFLSHWFTCGIWLVLPLPVPLNNLWDLGGFTTICPSDLPVGSGWFYHYLSLWFTCGIWVVLPLSVPLIYLWDLDVLPLPVYLIYLWDLGDFTTFCLSDLPVGSGWFYHCRFPLSIWRCLASVSGWLFSPGLGRSAGSASLVVVFLEHGCHYL